jgi:ribosomal protein L27
MTESEARKRSTTSSVFTRDSPEGRLDVVNTQQAGIEAPDIELQRKSGTVIRPAKWVITLTNDDGEVTNLSWFNTKAKAIEFIRELWRMGKDSIKHEEE